MILDDGYTPEHNVDWVKTVRGIATYSGYNPSLKTLVWKGLNFSSYSQLATALDKLAAPIVVSVPSISTKNGCAVVGKKPGGHFVLVTGKVANSDGSYTFSVNDPGCASNKTLALYPSFASRGYVKDPADQSALTFDADDLGELTVLDPAGNKTGFTGTATPDIFDIPDSYYYRDFITDADTGTDPTETTHYLGMTTPQPGRYVVVMSGLQAGSFSLIVNGYSIDGGSLSPVSISGKVGPGSSTSYNLTYDSAPGTQPTMSAILGDVNGDGIVNCLDLAIVKSSFGKKVGTPGFDGRTDVNLDGVVDVHDLALVAQHLPAGMSCH